MECTTPLISKGALRVVKSCSAEWKDWKLWRFQINIAVTTRQSEIERPRPTPTESTKNWTPTSESRTVW